MSDSGQKRAKPERHGRPAGSRAHFLKLNATGTFSIATLEKGSTGWLHRPGERSQPGVVEAVDAGDSVASPGGGQAGRVMGG